MRNPHEAERKNFNKIFQYTGIYCVIYKEIILLGKFAVRIQFNKTRLVKLNSDTRCLWMTRKRLSNVQNKTRIGNNIGKKLENVKIVGTIGKKGGLQMTYEDSIHVTGYKIKETEQ